MILLFKYIYINSFVLDILACDFFDFLVILSIDDKLFVSSFESHELTDFQLLT